MDPGAKYAKAKFVLRTVSVGLEQFKLKHGEFPEFSNFDQMIENNSPLVKENFIPGNTPNRDPWGQEFMGVSSKSMYRLECAGNQADIKRFPPISIVPGAP